jgi:hypothetical protein
LPETRRRPALQVSDQAVYFSCNDLVAAMMHSVSRPFGDDSPASGRKGFFAVQLPLVLFPSVVPAWEFIDLQRGAGIDHHSASDFFWKLAGVFADVEAAGGVGHQNERARDRRLFEKNVQF